MIDGFWERTLGERAHLEAILAVPDDVGSQDESSEDDQGPSKGIESVLGADWNPAVRSIGAFVGIAFAIVSTLSSSDDVEPLWTSLD